MSRIWIRALVLRFDSPSERLAAGGSDAQRGCGIQLQPGWGDVTDIHAHQVAVAQRL